MDIHVAEQLVPEPSLVEMEVAIGKLKRYKSLGTDHILAELIREGGETLCSEIHKTYSFHMEQGSFATTVEEIYYCINL
jgi:hypothetical protein